jgi:hypothetical protein
MFPFFSEVISFFLHFLAGLAPLLISLAWLFGAHRCAVRVRAPEEKEEAVGSFLDITQWGLVRWVSLPLHGGLWFSSLMILLVLAIGTQEEREMHRFKAVILAFQKDLDLTKEAYCRRLEHRPICEQSPLSWSLHHNAQGRFLTLETQGSDFSIRVFKWRLEQMGFSAETTHKGWRWGYPETGRAMGYFWPFYYEEKIRVIFDFEQRYAMPTVS